LERKKKKRKEHVEEIYDIDMEKFWGSSLFFYNIKFSSFDKNCIEGAF